MGLTHYCRTYVGLTDDPDRSRTAHSEPYDWTVLCFSSPSEALEWKELMLQRGCVTGTRNGGWRVGYTYTITAQTVE